jgi:outer membrane receptor protein involved in Fe transport
LSSAINSSVTSITINGNGEWPLVPSQSAGFYVLIDNELMFVTAASGPANARVMTVVRARYSTAASSHSRNARVFLRQILGERGPAGAQGPAGPTGPAGPAGDGGSFWLF